MIFPSAKSAARVGFLGFQIGGEAAAIRPPLLAFGKPPAQGIERFPQ
jgi:hypothetical protein